MKFELDQLDLSDLEVSRRARPFPTKSLKSPQQGMLPAEVISTRTVISWGLVAIPVAIYTSTQSNDISFNQLHKDDHQKIQYKKVCGNCGKEVKGSDIVKGYQYDKDRFVIITDDELERIKTEQERSIQILHFALLEAQKIAIGKTVLDSHAVLMALIHRQEGLLISTMHFEDEIKDFPKSYSRPEITDQELTMARPLIASMNVPFDPAAYHDEYQVKLRQMIEDKIAGKEIVAAPQAPKGNVIDLMDALRASIEQQNRPVEPEKSKRTRKATKGA